jgi:hypothetical protein
METDARDPQPSKALSPTVVTPLPMTTDTRFWLALNALSPIAVTPSGIMRWVRKGQAGAGPPPAYVKAPIPISVTSAAKVTLGLLPQQELASRIA